jgi:hypothetical protein
VSSSLPNICLAELAAERGSSTVRPLVSMRWITRWSSTIFCFARSRMSSSTLPLVRNLRKRAGFGRAANELLQGAARRG